jgi:hypothetical protein
MLHPRPALFPFAIHQDFPFTIPLQNQTES